MPRPPSITLFERLYLGSIALYVLNAVLFWSQTRAIVAGSPQVQANAQVAALAGPIIIGSLVLTVGVSLLLWWLVARQRSEAGKWAVIATEVVGALFGLLALLRIVQAGAVKPSVALGLGATALAVAAAAMLLRADAKPWFVRAEVPADPV